jgi:hypothetical protein
VKLGLDEKLADILVVLFGWAETMG